MMTDTEMAQLQTLLDDEATPLPIRGLLQMVLKCTDNLVADQQRLDYLEGLARDILHAPANKLTTITYMPDKCPPVPLLMFVGEVRDQPAPGGKEALLFMGARELGMQLLTPMEAAAYLQGINVGASMDRDKISTTIMLVLTGQRIRGET